MKDKRTEIHHNFDMLEGTSSNKEYKWLYKTAKQLNAYNYGVIVEIGSFKGKGTIALAIGSKEGSKKEVYAVDLKENPEFRENLNNYEVAEIVKPLFQNAYDVDKNWGPPPLLF